MTATTLYRITGKIPVYLLLCLLSIVLLWPTGRPGIARAHGMSPYRAFYPDIKTISTEELAKNLASLTLVDVRSRFQFDVVHIDNSINLPSGDEDFTARIDSLKEMGSDLRLVMVGNDPDCALAFHTARIAVARGITNVKVYDAGVFSWLHSYPDKTHLMGEMPASLERVLPLVTHQIHQLSYAAFLDLSRHPDAIVIDLRDFFSRRIVPADMSVRNITLHAFLDAVASRIWTDRKLLFFDADGSTTRWLQIFLQARGYHDFYFLEGGVRALPADTIFRFIDTEGGVVSINPAELKQVIKSLWKQGELVEFLSFILSSVQSRNLSFVSHRSVEIRLGLEHEQIRDYSERLAATGTLRFFEYDENFIYQVDPLLAWKGEMSGIEWQREVNQFHNRYGD